MAFDTLILKNPATSEIKRAPVGFSWTFFFFGSFVPLFRADWKWLVITAVIALCTFGFSTLVFCFIYNKLYIKDLVLSSGFKVQSSENGDVQLASANVGLELPML
jgi:hypothetical protein